jgi:hypothetical protein
MFDLKKPCNNCPFLKTQGRLFGLSRLRLKGIFRSPAFQCHKTLNGRPQQCAGIMSVLHKSNKPNSIMDVAEAMTDWRAADLDHTNTYNSIEEATEDHNELKRDK